MAFDTPAGGVFLESGDESMTPFGGFVSLPAFLQKLVILDVLAETAPVIRTGPNASRPRDILTLFFPTTFIDGSRFAHVNRLREDPLVAAVAGTRLCPHYRWR
ncbi:MAG: hypothetical protein EA425_13785, partial [Puniceicoccaceae bacterium]